MTGMTEKMNIAKLHISRHAARRMARRGITLRDLDLTLRFGRKIHRTGVTFYFFGRRQIPRGLERQLERLVGTTLIVADGQLITAYRNKRAIATIKKKPKRRAKLLPNPVPALLTCAPMADDRPLWGFCA
ncbi:hypothetical protein HRbin10_00544 [bacterium HR10]|nr:hypothetical protein HRbin10_00544 [bacterium HR10]